MLSQVVSFLALVASGSSCFYGSTHSDTFIRSAPKKLCDFGGSGERRGETDLSTLSALSNIDSVDSVGSNGSCQMETLLVFPPHILPSLQGFPKNGFSSTRARSQRERVGLGVRQEGRRVATITPQCHDGLAHEH